MRDPIMFLFGGFIASIAIPLWMALSGQGRKGSRLSPETRPDGRTARRWAQTGCAVLGAAGLDVAASYGIGTSSFAAGGITIELGLALMVLSVVWSIFRDAVLRFQLWLGTALYGLQRPADPDQVTAGENVGSSLRIVLFLLGLIIVVARVTLR